ncbi:MAG: hypothetical protein HRT89_14030 [Lentisphaeria bacterium]|nr:hypothetical protein [Lentisphaeria bacterium]NQZ69174.1 hypothetical protein [Lentisphaeria bacterium]
MKAFTFGVFALILTLYSSVLVAEEKPKKPLHKSGKVVSIDAEKKVIVVRARVVKMTSKNIDESKIPTYTFHYTDDTQAVCVKDRGATLEDLKDGERIVVVYELKEKRMIAKKIMWGMLSRRR